LDLYKITFIGNTYFYCSSSEDLQFGADLYHASSIIRSEISTEINNSEVRITAHISTDPVKFFVMSSPSAELSIEIYDYFSGFLLFNGVLTKIIFDREKETSELTFKRKEDYLDSEVPYRTYGNTCSLGLYSPECGVNKSSFSSSFTTYTISTSRKIITLPGLSSIPKNFIGGYLSIAGKETSYITNQVGDVITIDQPIFSTSGTITLIMGCNKSISSCESIFNNLINFGGFPFIPAKNPASESI